RHHVKQCGVLSRFGAGIAARRERIYAPEPGRDRIGIDAVGHFLRHLGKIGPEGVERGFSVAKSRFGPQIIGDDAGLARLNAARLPQILEAEIGIERAIRTRGKTRVGAPPHARQVCISTPTSVARFCKSSWPVPTNSPPSSQNMPL